MKIINSRVLGTIMLIVLLLIIVIVTYKKWVITKSPTRPATTEVVDSVINIDQLFTDSIAASKAEDVAFDKWYEVKEVYVSGLDSLTKVEHELMHSIERGERPFSDLDSTLRRHYLERQVLGTIYVPVMDSLRSIWAEKYHKYQDVASRLLTARRAIQNQKL